MQLRRVYLQSEATANGDGEELDLTTGGIADAGGTLGVQVIGTFTANVNFEITLDGDNWVAFDLCENGNISDGATAATAAGYFSSLFPLPGLKFRARISDRSDGTITVIAMLAIPK